jgi:hypothetical protein
MSQIWTLYQEPFIMLNLSNAKYESNTIQIRTRAGKYGPNEESKRRCNGFPDYSGIKRVVINLFKKNHLFTYCTIRCL